MQRKQLLGYLLLNVVVSASTVWLVLTLWSRSQQAAVERAVAGIPQPLESPPAVTEVVIPTAAPERPLQPHQVRPGETLSDIALLYDTTVDELLAINGMSNADSLGANQVIYVPAPTKTPLASVPAASPVAGETPAAAVGGIQIVSVVGVGDLGTERVLLGEVGGGKHVLAGWQLRDEDGNVYTFPQVTLYEGGQIVVNTRVGVDTPLELFWGL